MALTVREMLQRVAASRACDRGSYFGEWPVVTKILCRDACRRRHMMMGLSGVYMWAWSTTPSFSFRTASKLRTARLTTLGAAPPAF